MKKIYLVTNGIGFNGYNAYMAEHGFEQIVRIREDLIPRIIPHPTLVGIGTGARFEDTYNALKPALNGIPIMYSPFIGGPEGIDENGLVTLHRGKVNAERYIGLVDNPGFDAWRFLNGCFPCDTLLCSGEELLLALDLGKLYVPGALIEIDATNRVGRQIG